METNRRKLSATIAGLLLAAPLVLAVGGPHSSAATNTSTFTAGADSFVDKSRPNDNFGTRSVLRTDASPVQRSYLRFGVSGLGGPVSKATLQVYAQDSSSSGFTVNGAGSATWGEKTLTWANAPAPGGAAASSGPLTTGQWTSVDVTGLVPGNGTVNVALTTTAGAATRYGSRESTHAPRLVVETALSTTTTTAPPTTTTTTAPSGSKNGCTPALTPRQATYNILGYLFGDGHYQTGGYNWRSSSDCRLQRMRHDLAILGLTLTGSGPTYHLPDVAPFNRGQDFGPSPETAVGTATAEDLSFFLAGILEGEGSGAGKVLDDPNWGRTAGIVDLYKRVGVVVKPDHVAPDCGCATATGYWNTFVDPAADKTTYNGYIGIIRSWSYGEMTRVPQPK